MESLAEFLRERAVGRTMLAVDVVAFQALKTFDPPVTALGGLTVTGVTRHGKFSTSTATASTWSSTSRGRGGCAGATTCRARNPSVPARVRWR